MASRHPTLDYMQYVLRLSFISHTELNKQDVSVSIPLFVLQIVSRQSTEV